MTGVYDVIVVGAGVEGSATAWQLAKNNYKTLLLEQFVLPHTRGSSHGQSRITRKAYTKDTYAQMMKTCYDMWEKLEKDENTEIFIQTGVLSVQEHPAKELDNTVAALANIKSVYEPLDHAALTKRFPMFRLDASYRGVYDPEGGMLRADRALKCYWNQFQKHGGVIRDGEEVTQITPGNPVTVTTPKGRYQGNSIVLCAGPWTSKLISPLGLQLPLKPIRVTVYYWKCLTDEFTQEKGMPSFMIHKHRVVGVDLYGMPAVEYPNHVKICAHGGPDIDPDTRDAEAAVRGSQTIDAGMKKIIQENFPGAEPDASIKEMCIYTLTPDEDFILDTHPQWKNIVIGAGFSGHGFKLSPVVGMLLSELATGKRPSFNMKPFEIARFDKSNQSSKL